VKITKEGENQVPVVVLTDSIKLFNKLINLIQNLNRLHWTL